MSENLVTDLASLEALFGELAPPSVAKETDSLRNLIPDPRVGETLRVRGRAHIRVEPAVLASFEHAGKRPLCVLRISVDKVFFQCARSILRSRLWHPQEHDRSDVPSPGTMLAALTRGQIDGDTYDSALPQRQRESLY